MSCSGIDDQLINSMMGLSVPALLAYLPFVALPRCDYYHSRPKTESSDSVASDIRFVRLCLDSKSPRRCNGNYMKREIIARANVQL